MAVEPTLSPSGPSAWEGLSPEEALLAACATTRTDPATRRAVEIALSAPRLDWHALLTLSIRHGVAPSLALHLGGFAEDPRLPAGITTFLSRYAAANAHRNQILFRETGRLVKALTNARIACLVLKGVGLALTVYPDHTLRNFADIDILVDPSALEHAGEVAISCGFCRADPQDSERESHTRYVMQCPEDILSDMLPPGQALPPDSVDTLRHQILVELHRGVFRLASGHLRRVDMVPFWLHPQAITLPDGTPLALPSREAMIVHLACHAADHDFMRLIFPLDIAQALASYGTELDWERLVALAAFYEVKEKVYRLLVCVQANWEAEIPGEVLQKLAEGQGNGARESPLTLPYIFAAMQTRRSARTWRRFMQTASPWERILAGWYILWPPVESMRQRHRPQSNLHLAALYLARPFQITVRMVRLLFR